MNDPIETNLDDMHLYAQSLDMTFEEYALSLHVKNQTLKSVLLENGTDFKNFVTEYHDVLDGLTHYRDSEASKSSFEHYDLIKSVTSLLTTTSQSPNILAQLYQYYPEGITGQLSELNNPVN